MFTAKHLTTTSLAMLALGSSVILAGPSGGTTANAQPAGAPASISAYPYSAQGPNPLDPPRVVGEQTAFGIPTAGDPGSGGGPE